MSSLLQVKRLSKVFPTHVGMLHAVDDVSFEIERGKTLGVVGESGCGKTTLGRVIVGLVEATSGNIFYDNEDITEVTVTRRRQLRKKIQIVFQDPLSSLDPRMTVSEIIQEPLTIFKLCKNHTEYRKRVLSLMDVVGLSFRYENAYPHELDGGRCQRVGIARALSLEPEFIVCDEPVSSLDVSIQAQILNLLQDLQEEKKLTYIFITHDLSVVKHISHDILVMYMGKMVEKCSSKELFHSALHPYTQALLSAIPIPRIGAKADFIPLKGEISSPINPQPGCRFEPRCTHALSICKNKDPLWQEYSSSHYAACHQVLPRKENIPSTKK